MSNEKYETIEDIVAEMRNEGLTGDSLCLEWVGAKIHHYADRIEAAAKREREAGADAAQICGEIGEMIGREAACKEEVEDCNRLGNAAAMREALLRCDAIAQMPEIREYVIVKDMRNLIKKALSAPPRKFDV